MAAPRRIDARPLARPRARRVELSVSDLRTAAGLTPERGSCTFSLKGGRPIGHTSQGGHTRWRNDPRTDTGIPTEPVGSLPRPAKLQAAYADYDAGKITKDQLEAEQDEAVEDSITRMEATGSPIVSDGEQRWSSFATYPITDTLAGTGLADNLGGGGQYFAIFADGHNRQLPRLTGGPFRYKTFAADTLAKSIKYASKPMKQAVIAPSMLALLYPLNEEVPGYSREAFEEDLTNECEKDIRRAFEAGAARVSIDFTEGRLATRADPRNPWTGAGMLPHFIELNNRVIDRFTPEERTRTSSTRCDGDHVWIVPGRPERKTWWRNLRTAAPVEIWLAGEHHHGTAVAVDGRDHPSDVVDALGRYLTALPRARERARRRRRAQPHDDRARFIVVRVDLGRGPRAHDEGATP